MLDLLKLLLILGLTVFLLMRKWDLGLVLLLDAVLVALLFAYPPLAFARSVLRSLVAKDTLALSGAVFLVLILAELMRRTHAMETMVASLQALVPDNRITLALMPLTIGLMPMLGGAMFSAPMVNEVGEPMALSPERKTFVNYWFRHSMEYVFPLYSSLLMIAALFDVSVFDFIQASWPLTVISLVAGVVWGLAGIERPARPTTTTSERQGRCQTWMMLLRAIWPILLVVLTVVVLKLNMLVSLMGVIVIFAVVKGIGPDQWGDVLKRGFPLHTFTAIFGVFIFKHVMEDAGAVARIPEALGMLGLPVMVIAFVVPMLVGLLTGTAAAALALSVPLVAPLLTSQAMDPLTVGMWLFTGGFSGVLLSPLHLCLALTHDYFGASWGPLYRRIVPAVAMIVAGSVWLLLLL